MGIICRTKLRAFDSSSFFAVAIAVAGVLLISCVPLLSAQRSPQGQSESDWTAPESAKSIKNPVPASPQVLGEAKETFESTCATCHGVKGAGDGPVSDKIKPRPANFTNAKRMSSMTDGEIFWKISNGRGPMPAWSQIPENDRWGLVDYIRTFAAAKPKLARKPS